MVMLPKDAVISLLSCLGGQCFILKTIIQQISICLPHSSSLSFLLFTKIILFFLLRMYETVHPITRLWEEAEL